MTRRRSLLVFRTYRRAWRSSQTPSEPIPCQYLPGLPGTVGVGSGYGESGGRGMKDCLMLIVSSFSVWLLSVLLAIMHILSTHLPLNRPWPPVRMHVPSTACDVIGFNGQCQLCPLTCAKWRDLSKMSTIQSRTTEKKVKNHVTLTRKCSWKSCSTTDLPFLGSNPKILKAFLKHFSHQNKAF